MCHHKSHSNPDQLDLVNNTQLTQWQLAVILSGVILNKLNVDNNMMDVLRTNYELMLQAR